MSDFAQQLIRWQKNHGRHNLPWQGSRDAYRIWVSEIMLQQTQVGTVIPYYLRFLDSFPDLIRLAAAPLDAVLAHWSGLGYYARARNLHAAAQQVMTRHGGVFPERIEDIAALPGIGRSTAAAIAAFAFGARHAILDGNVKRVLARHYGVAGHPGAKKTETELWQLAQSLLPAHEVEVYTQALMDFGAMLCTRSQPACTGCPLRGSCVALATDRVAMLPAPRPKKSTPLKHTQVMILRHAGAILLEKRPPTGIWGGLWSLPEASPGTDVVALCHTRLGMEVTATASLPELRHSFSHFCLSITPRLLDVTRIHPRAQQGEQLWLTPRDAQDTGIPAPVRTLLRQLDEMGAGK